MAMTFEKALREAMKAYWEGDEYDNAQSFKDKKYNKKYFESVKSEVLETKVDMQKDKK